MGRFLRGRVCRDNVITAASSPAVSFVSLRTKAILKMLYRHTAPARCDISDGITGEERLRRTIHMLETTWPTPFVTGWGCSSEIFDIRKREVASSRTTTPSRSGSHRRFASHVMLTK
ncbi:unnamed protein product [Albugo candida]|uniref:Uncharacterized protein n=1 Tax=Albugo candida TaxID=65357 RepID=A0A024FU21_9STRA|nr:unnamed protein product [Albugo candida]|eukprot:CCI10648.1 unnamed protein product [Albugo candida]